MQPEEEKLEEVELLAAEHVIDITGLPADAVIDLTPAERHPADKILEVIGYELSVDECCNILQDAPLIPIKSIDPHRPNHYELVAYLKWLLENEKDILTNEPLNRTSLTHKFKVNHALIAK